jgi:hypothetical protein
MKVLEVDENKKRHDASLRGMTSGKKDRNEKNSCCG